MDDGFPVKACCGSVVLSCLPYAHVLMGKERGTRCDQCFAQASKGQDLQRCSRCKVAYYCSQKCQKSAWRLHKSECAGFVRTRPNVPSESVRLLARLVLRYHSNEHLLQEEFEGLKGSRCFSDLESHTADVLSDPLRRQQMVTAQETLKAFLGRDFVDGVFPEGDSLILASIFGRMTVNSFSILDSELCPIGVGLFLGASKVDHACDANLTPHFQGVRLILRANRDIENASFATLSLPYVEQLAPTWERQSHLSKQYFFTCTCPWCQSGEEMETDAAGNTAAAHGAAAATTDNLSSIVCNVIGPDSAMTSKDGASDASNASNVASTLTFIDPTTLSTRDKSLLSIACPCSLQSTCPVTKSRCGGRLELKRFSSSECDDSASAAASASLPPLQLSDSHCLDLNSLRLSSCDFCFCETDAASRPAIFNQYLDVVHESRNTLNLIRDRRKQDADISESEKSCHFKAVLDLCCNLLKRQREGLLNNYNIFMLRTLDEAFDVSIHQGLWQEALDHGTSTLAPFRHYYPSPHPTVGIQILKVAKIRFFLRPSDQATSSLLTDAVEILRLTHGPRLGASLHSAPASVTGVTGVTGVTSVTGEAEELLQQCRDELRTTEALGSLSNAIESS